MKYSYRINHDDENEVWIPFEHFGELEKYLNEMKSDDILYTVEVAIEFSPERIFVIEATKEAERKGLFRKLEFRYELDVIIGTTSATKNWYVREFDEEAFYQSFKSAIEHPEFIDFSDWDDDTEHLDEDDQNTGAMDF